MPSYDESPMTAMTLVFSALSNEKRLRLLVYLLQQGDEVAVTDAMIHFSNVPQPSFSLQLKALREAGLVSVRREKNQAFAKATVQADLARFLLRGI